MDPGTRGPRVDAALRTSRAACSQPATCCTAPRRPTWRRSAAVTRRPTAAEYVRGSAWPELRVPIECEPPLHGSAPTRSSRRPPPPRGFFALRSTRVRLGAEDRGDPGGPDALGRPHPPAGARPLRQAAARWPARWTRPGGPVRVGVVRSRVSSRPWSTRSRPTAWKRTPSKLEQHSDQLGERIEDIRDDWERKEQDDSVPGAQPDRTRRRPGEEETRATMDTPTLGGVEVSGGRSRPDSRRCSRSASCCCSSTRPR